MSVDRSKSATWKCTTKTKYFQLFNQIIGSLLLDLCALCMLLQLLKTIHGHQHESLWCEQPFVLYCFTQNIPKIFVFEFSKLFAILLRLLNSISLFRSLEHFDSFWKCSPRMYFIIVIGDRIYWCLYLLFGLPYLIEMAKRKSVRKYYEFVLVEKCINEENSMFIHNCALLCVHSQL